jgi:dolichyl-phosphate beta-glucosyltransferase
MSKYPSLSIIVPAYNESARIESALTEIVKAIWRNRWDAEVIVVDDGSADDTAEVVTAFGLTDPEVRLVQNFQNRGKGYSVRAGMLYAEGEIVLFTDADLSAPIDEAQRLIDAIRTGADIAIGSRWLDTSRQTHRQPFYRQFFGRCFNLVTRSIMGLPYADTQCGFKAFTWQAAQIVFGLQTIERWGFDPEILFIANQRGLLVREIPVSWAHDARSKVSYLRDGARMLREIATIRGRALIGRYDGEVTPAIRHRHETTVAL